jgi:hypothetical protein
MTVDIATQSNGVPAAVEISFADARDQALLQVLRQVLHGCFCMAGHDPPFLVLLLLFVPGRN